MFADTCMIAKYTLYMRVDVLVILLLSRIWYTARFACHSLHPVSYKFPNVG